jgi:hypothetical protein
MEYAGSEIPLLQTSLKKEEGSDVTNGGSNDNAANRE